MALHLGKITPALYISGSQVLVSREREKAVTRQSNGGNLIKLQNNASLR